MPLLLALYLLLTSDLLAENSTGTRLKATENLNFARILRHITYSNTPYHLLSRKNIIDQLKPVDSRGDFKNRVSFILTDNGAMNADIAACRAKNLFDKTRQPVVSSVYAKNIAKTNQ